MDCREARDLIQDHLDDRLDAAEHRGVEAHLETCPACSAECAALRRTVALVKNMGRVTAPESLARDIIERIGPGVPPAGRRFSLPLSIAGISAAAALLFVAVIIFLPEDPVVAPGEILMTDGGLESGEPRKSDHARELLTEEIDAEASAPAGRSGRAIQTRGRAKPEKPRDRLVEIRVKNPEALAAQVRSLLVDADEGDFGPQGETVQPDRAGQKDVRVRAKSTTDNLAKKTSGEVATKIPDIRLDPADLRKLLAVLDRIQASPLPRSLGGAEGSPGTGRGASRAGGAGGGVVPDGVWGQSPTVDVAALRRAIRELDKRRDAVIVLRLSQLPPPPAVDTDR